MTSLTTMTATSALMRQHGDEQHAPHTARLNFRRKFLMRDVATVVVLVLAIGGGVAAALATPVPSQSTVVAARA